MSGAFRCASISDSRQWLDCYYGVAQPVRIQLGLPSALPDQLRLAASPPADGGSITDTAIRDEVMFAAFRCNGFSDSRQWLNCYYGAAQPMRIHLGLSAAPLAPVQPKPGPRTGAEMAASPARSMVGPPPSPSASRLSERSGNFEASWTPVRVISRMVSYSFDQKNTFTVTLANGQVWRQMSGDNNHAGWKAAAASYMAKITRDWSGNYTLEIPKNPQTFQVERVR